MVAAVVVTVTLAVVPARVSFTVNPVLLRAVTWPDAPKAANPPPKPAPAEPLGKAPGERLKDGRALALPVNPSVQLPLVAARMATVDAVTAVGMDAADPAPAEPVAGVAAGDADEPVRTSRTVTQTPTFTADADTFFVLVIRVFDESVTAT